jgi:tryptophanyl-tRNA synthetase
MSKSSPDLSSRILLTDTATEISKKLRSAVTDSEPIITYSPSTRPGIANLLTILAACTSTPEKEVTPEECAEEYRDWDKKEFKEVVSEAVEGRLGPIRGELERLRGDQGYLREVGERGAERARERAGKVLKEVKEKVGLGRI